MSRAVGKMGLSGNVYVNNSVPGPCRLCGGPTWFQDEEGAVHSCCALHGAECLACRASEQLNREQRRRKSKPWKEVKAEGVDG